MSILPDETTPDLHTTAGKLAELERRLDDAAHAGSAKAVEGAAEGDVVVHRSHED